MAHNWVHAATQNQTARLGDRLVLFILAECADIATGTCYPSVQTIADRALLSERATHYCLKRLVSLGLVTIRPNASEYGTNIYTLSRSMLGGANFAPGGVQNTTENVHDFAPKPSSKPSDNKTPISPTPRTNKNIDGFESWYRDYPRKQKRVDAENAWRKMSPDEREQAMTGLTRYQPYFAEQEPQYIPLPASWLNGKRWLDEIPTPKGKAKPKSVGNRMTAEELVGFVG